MWKSLSTPRHIDKHLLVSYVCTLLVLKKKKFCYKYRWIYMGKTCPGFLSGSCWGAPEEAWRSWSSILWAQIQLCESSPDLKSFVGTWALRVLNVLLHFPGQVQSFQAWEWMPCFSGILQLTETEKSWGQLSFHIHPIHPGSLGQRSNLLAFCFCK